jgi:hypothetical protein
LKGRRLRITDSTQKIMPELLPKIDIKKDGKIVGIIELVTVKGKKGIKTVKAKLDTGTDRTCVDYDLAAEVGLGPLVDTIKVRSASGKKPETHVLAEAEIIIHQQLFSLPVSLEDRSNMKYEVLIGRDLLERSIFLIDPRKIINDKI